MSLRYPFPSWTARFETPVMKSLRSKVSPRSAHISLLLATAWRKYSSFILVVFLCGLELNRLIGAPSCAVACVPVFPCVASCETGLSPATWSLFTLCPAAIPHNIIPCAMLAMQFIVTDLCLHGMVRHLIHPAETKNQWTSTQKHCHTTAPPSRGSWRSGRPDGSAVLPGP